VPEHNIIQRPELLRRLQQRMGMRQMHVAPAMNEGVQPVVILDDLTLVPSNVVPTFLGTAYRIGTAAAYSCNVLHNPPGSGVIAKIKRWLFTSIGATGTLQLANHSTDAFLSAVGMVTDSTVQGLTTRDLRYAQPNPTVGQNPFILSRCLLKCTHTPTNQINAGVIGQSWATQQLGVGFGWVEPPASSPVDIVLYPGEVFWTGIDIVNNTQSMAVLWEEESEN
jgi:hypothetical protein